jgi:hypothetical protein
MYASLEELRRKIGHVVKCAFQKSKLAWYNLIAKRCSRVAVKATVQETQLLRTAGVLPANSTFLEAAGEGFEPSLTDPELVKPSRGYRVCFR